MSTNEARSSVSFRRERKTLLPKTTQPVILPFAGDAKVAGQAAPAASRVRLGKASVIAPHPVVLISPADSAWRRMVRSPGITAELVREPAGERIEYRFHGPVHLLILFEGVRRDGETEVETLPRSALRDLSRKFVFVPANHNYRDWRKPVTPARVAFFYFDPGELPGEVLGPRLFFEDPHLFSTVEKLVEVIEEPEFQHTSYIDALGCVLGHELTRLDRASPISRNTLRGGLASWQQRAVAGYIEDHLANRIALAHLAGLIGLSTYHFCRAFKKSFGMPPHRYHMSRRIERAKALLANPAPSVTDIGFMVGFGGPSSFTATFRKATGLTPTAYHRNFTLIPHLQSTSMSTKNESRFLE